MPNDTASVAWAYDNEILGDDVSPFAQIWMWIGEFFEKDCFGAWQPHSPTHTHMLTCAIVCPLCGSGRKGPSHNGKPRWLLEPRT
jgi:hypothetical protein